MKIKLELEKGDTIELNGIFYRIDEIGSITEDPVLSRTVDQTPTVVGDNESIDILNLSSRARTALIFKLGVKTLGDIRELSIHDLIAVRYLGAKSIKEIRKKVNEYYGKPVL